jgi:hypothetical protein
MVTREQSDVFLEQNDQHLTPKGALPFPLTADPQATP